MPEFIRQSIEKQIEIAVLEEIEEAKKRIDKRKSEIVTGIVLYVQKEIQIETLGEKLIISVKIQ